MTFEQQQDLNGLETISLLSEPTLQTLAMAFVVFGIDAITFSESERMVKCIKIHPLDYNVIKQQKVWPNGSAGMTAKVTLTQGGKTYLKWLQETREIERLDRNAKSESIKNSRLQRIIVIVSLSIALISLFIPLAIWYIDKTEVKEVKVQSPQLQKLQQIQQELLELLRAKLYNPNH